MQSPTTTQGPGDAAADEDFVMPPHPAMLIAAGATMGRVETNAGLANLGNAGYLDDDHCSMQRQIPMATSLPMLKERRSLRDRTPRPFQASQVSASSPPPTTSTTQI